MTIEIGEAIAIGMMMVVSHMCAFEAGKWAELRRRLNQMLNVEGKANGNP